MPLRYRARILEHLSHDDYRPAEVDDVARLLRVPTEDRPAFDEAIDMLSSAGSIEIGDDDRVRLPRFGEVIEGRIKITTRGFAFVTPDTPTREGDLFVPQGQTGDAISGDRVRCRVVRRGEGWGGARRGAGAGPRGGRGGRGGSPGTGDRAVGRVIEVTERASRVFAGALRRDGRQWMVQPDGRRLREPIIIRDPHAKGAKEGDKVVVDVISFPTEFRHAEGVITEVLGDAGRPDVETQAVIAAFELPGAFSEPVIEQARAASRTFEAHERGPWPDRLDLTGELSFTIDPPDARDFDDAITISHDEARDEWTLGVHIADVASFVPLGGDLDSEARERGNSVYLPRHVIPMLPEVLSNGVCSLQEGVPRFTKSAIITLDGKGRPGHVRVANSVIRSSKRFTYLEAQAAIDGRLEDAKRQARSETEISEALLRALRLCERLAKIIEKRRRGQGMITLALPEVELVFDDSGRVTDAVPEDDSFTHRLIEMFMVEANEAITRIFADLQVPLLRRIHPEPGFGDLEELRQFARTAGMKVPEEPTRHDLQALLDATRHRDDARAIHFAVLRTLSKATYSPALIGHYALASDHYAHFTSPIRRYPDLSVHRALQAFLDLTGNGAQVPGGKKRRALAQALHEDSRVLDELALVTLGSHCSETEVRAEDAERDLRSLLVLQLLHEKHLGDEFAAVVTGVLGSSSVFVSLDKFLIDGVVRLDAAVSGGTRAARAGDRAGDRAGGRAGDRAGDRAGRSAAARGGDRGDRAGKPDRWVVNERDGRLVSVRSGASIGLGDAVRVVILAIDLASRSLELALAAPLAPRGGGAGRGPGGGAVEGRRDGGGATGGEDEDASRTGAPRTGARRGASRGIGTGAERDPRRDLLSRDQSVEHKGHRRGFKQGRRGRRSR